MRRYAASFPTGDAPVRGGVEGGDTNANKYGSSVVKGEVFYDGEEEN